MTPLRSLALLSCGFALVTLSCGSTTTPPCSFSTCSGCCLPDGQCAAGTSTSSCGSDGLACEDCGGTQTCSVGRCRNAGTGGGSGTGGGFGTAGGGGSAGAGGGAAACGPSTCAGCCNNGTCTAGNTNSLCGLGGAVCSSCFGGQTCNGGSCSNPACAPGNCAGCCLNGVCQPGNTASACGSGAAACTACMTNQICRVNQTCGVDPNSMWRVQPTRATITATNNGTAWDTDGSAADPYISMTCPPSTAPTTASTPFVQNSAAPTWTTGGCIARASALLAEPWRFQVFDDDLTTDDTITGGLQIQFNEANFVSGGWTGTGSGGLVNLTVQFQRQ